MQKLRLSLAFLGLFSVITFLGNAPAAAVSNQCKQLFLEFASRGPLPTERIKSVSKQGQKFWEDYNEKFIKNTREYIEKYLAFYVKEKESGNPHIAFLEILGFRFQPALVVPDLLPMMEQIELQVRHNILLDRIHEKDVLWPHMRIVVQDSIGQKLVAYEIEPGGELPSGQRWRDISAGARENTLLPDLIFAKAMAGGRFPIGALKSANRGNSVNEILHDLAHVGAMILHPEYMRAIRKGYQRLLKQTRGQSNVFKIGSPLWYKTFFALESFFAVKPEARSLLPGYFGIEPLLEIHPFPSQKQIEEFYTSLPAEQFAVISDRLRSDFSKYFEVLGGAQRDTLSYIGFDSQQFPLYHFTLHEPKPHRAALFAKFALGIKDLTLEQWMGFLLHHGPSPMKELTPLTSDDSFFETKESVGHWLLPIFRQ